MADAVIDPDSTVYPGSPLNSRQKFDAVVEGNVNVTARGGDIVVDITHRIDKPVAVHIHQ